MRRVLLYISALCLALTAFQAGQSPETGRVSGRVRLTTKVPGTPLASAAYPRRTVGDRDDFPNGDPFFHNVFSLSRAANFNLGRFERGRSRAREFTKAGT